MKMAAPFILQLGAKDNGKSVSVGGEEDWAAFVPQSRDFCATRAATLHGGSPVGAAFFQVTGNPRGFAAAIHHRPDPSLSSHDVAVDRIGKSSRKQTMRTEHDTVNTRIERQRIDIGVKRVEEVVAQSRLLAGPS